MTDKYWCIQVDGKETRVYDSEFEAAAAFNNYWVHTEFTHVVDLFGKVLRIPTKDEYNALCKKADEIDDNK